MNNIIVSNPVYHQMLSRLSGTAFVTIEKHRSLFTKTIVRQGLLATLPKYSVYFIPNRRFSTKPEENKLTNRIWTVPNVLSGIRFALAPVIGVLTLKGLFLPSLCTFAFASALDFADGYIARRFNQRSRLGTFIDPVADKSLMVCLAIAMGYTGLIHTPVAALIIGKDLLMGFGFFGIAWMHGYHHPKEMLNMIKSLEIKPSLLGKANTVLQMALLITGLCRPLWAFPSIQLFLPLELVVSLTTVATLVSYTLSVNKSIKLGDLKKKKPVVLSLDDDSDKKQEI